jgi:hypothetical protein
MEAGDGTADDIRSKIGFTGSRLYATCYMVDGAGMPNRAKTGSLRRGAVYRARGKVKGLSACKATGCKATG